MITKDVNSNFDTDQILYFNTMVLLKIYFTKILEEFGRNDAKSE
jgi:hypothetical protein